MRNRIKAPVVLMLGTLAMTGCDILDVKNPNALVEESIRQEAAANAVVNGSLALVSAAVSQVWQQYLVASDEFYWIGSRDAYLSLDKGFVDDPNNEFIDGNFPSMAQARWMADEAVEILTEHVAANPTTSLQTDLARAQLYAGLIHIIIGEIQEDFAESDKTEDGPPVGPDNMYTFLDEAVTHLTAAISGAQTVGDADLEVFALALRARAHQSRAIWDAINPAPGGGVTMVNSAAAGTDALAVIGMSGGVAADVQWDLTYSASSGSNSMASWINDRKENQVDLTLVTVDAANDIDGIAMQDPIDGVDDPALIKRLNQWKDGSYLDKGGVYPPLTVSSTRLMHLILAENALATGDNTGFTTHINHVRAMDGLTDYAAQIPAEDMMMHERRMNTLIMGLRLADMYRWGIEAAEWEPTSDAVTRPGTMLPISIIEIRANCHLNGLGCGG